MPQQPNEQFFQTFTDATIQGLVSALHRAYETARELHDPARGGNEQTFGFGLYNYAAHELSAEVKTLGELAKVETDRPCFRLRFGEFVVACHRVGRSAVQDIATCFPSNDGAAPALIERTLWFPGMEPQIHLARNLVLAHLGNPETGLEAAYLCMPSRKKQNRIAEWGYTHRIWISGDVIVPRPKPTATTIVPEEIIDEPVVRRKEREVGA